MTMIAMEETSFEQHYRTMNYVTLDRCQVVSSTDNDESCRQLHHCNEQVNDEHNVRIQLIVTHRWHVLLLVFLILTSHCNALPMLQSLSMNRYQQQRLVYLPPLSSPRPIDRSMYPTTPSFDSAKVYRHYSLPGQQQQQQQLRQPIPSYSNGAQVQLSNPAQIFYQRQQQQQQQPISSAINNNLMNQQLQRERQRRAMIDRMLALFDEDGNGQLTKDELYSMALRSNMFPKFHYYLKQTPI